jgi:phospholipase/lecithinase/hemolysin
MAATQIDNLISAFRKENNHPNQSDEVDFLDGLKTTFLQLEALLSQNASDTTRIKELEALLESSQQEVINLSKLLTQKPTALHTIITTAVGAAAGAGIVSAAQALWGATASDAINLLQELIGPKSAPAPSLMLTEV